MISHSRANGQFLPRLASFNFQSHHPEPQPRNIPLDSAMRTAQRSAPELHTSTASCLRHQDDVTHDVKHDTATNKDADNTKISPCDDPGDVASLAVRPGFAVVDRKKDRKTQARRHLVEGLNTGQFGSNGRRLCRSNTFNVGQGVTINPVNYQRAVLYKDEKEYESQVDKKFLKRISGARNIQKEDSSKVKKAIENWNELVLELNTEKYRRLSLDSDTSSNEDVPSPVHRHKTHVPLYASHSILPSKTLLNASQRVNTSKSKNPFSSGLSFARYRPITPNLLIELDKNKMSSRKKTQRWINRLEVQSRSYNIPTATKAPLLPQAETSCDTAAGSLSPPEGVKTVPGERTLHRTESYGSTRTGQSLGNSHTRRQPSDFL